ncbi:MULTISPECIES: YraN family protein [Acinetobacter]|uniref:UPF0102 protein FSC09_04475 n=1 Tax=Acinetobacter indicus TaxID=756892 RepID=A0A6C0Y0K4_9GAMM|nr:MULTISPECIES: YraN family protein [Acinetobacter]MCP0915901.1 YraN family protein [Acinetobacter indicus]MCP0919027.1 YraN family protein [Acinetobacter indicus]MCP0921693.1 YraN family protein [Acinetobacter indicus]MDM1269340.1 YraN family protein [Acinetobacter indicus]MDM1300882.1 YraN family protein [Acinetobacter indicus]
MASQRARLGQWAEQQAAMLLEQQGYQILAANYHCRYGEIDLIARQDQQLVFVEVKARSFSDYGRAVEVVSISKQQKLIKTALTYLSNSAQLQDFYCRFDVICFDFTEQIAKTVQQDFSNFTYDLQWIENAFTFDSEFINL